MIKVLETRDPRVEVTASEYPGTPRCAADVTTPMGAAE